MKKMIIGFCFVMAAFVSNAQIRKIPSTVTDAFKSKYPNAQKVEWKDNLTSFEASFVNSGVNTSAYFDSKGNWNETDKELSYDGLSSTIKDGYKKSKYNPDWAIKDVIEIQKPDGSTQYRLQVKKNGVQLKYLYFTTDGQLVKEALTL